MTPRRATQRLATTKHVQTVLLAIVLIAPLLLAACAKTTSDANRVSGTLDDATITTRVKTAFINDPVIGLARIDVDTFKGVVTLSGRVNSKDEEAKAISLARGIRGVTDVRSKLQIQ